MLTEIADMRQLMEPSQKKRIQRSNATLNYAYAIANANGFELVERSPVMWRLTVGDQVMFVRPGEQTVEGGDAPNFTPWSVRDVVAMHAARKQHN